MLQVMACLPVWQVGHKLGHLPSCCSVIMVDVIKSVLCIFPHLPTYTTTEHTYNINTYRQSLLTTDELELSLEALGFRQVTLILP